ncbi:MAG: hypothetical protein HC906_03895 [Bacteroidales bacterium]|nr:hypothetical protein [Bacteroidales bacterium]
MFEKILFCFKPALRSTLQNLKYFYIGAVTRKSANFPHSPKTLYFRKPVYENPPASHSEFFMLISAAYPTSQSDDLEKALKAMRTKDFNEANS